MITPEQKKAIETAIGCMGDVGHDAELADARDRLEELLAAADAPTRVLVCVEGGCVTAVLADGPATAEVWDWDERPADEGPYLAKSMPYTHDALEPTACECDGGHESVDTVCIWCWARGRRRRSDPDVAADALLVNADHVGA